MPLAMLPNKSLQHCQEQMIQTIIIVDDFTLKNFHVLNTINSFLCAKQDGKAKKSLLGN